MGLSNVAANARLGLGLGVQVLRAVIHRHISRQDRGTTKKGNGLRALCAAGREWRSGGCWNRFFKYQLDLVVFVDIDRDFAPVGEATE